jgi:hypothetical protein
MTSSTLTFQVPQIRGPITGKFTIVWNNLFLVSSGSPPILSFSNVNTDIAAGGTLLTVPLIVASVSQKITIQLGSGPSQYLSFNPSSPSSPEPKIITKSSSMTLEPEDSNVDLNNLYAGVSYTLNSFTGVYFIPLDSTNYNLIINGTVNTSNGDPSSFITYWMTQSTFVNGLPPKTNTELLIKPYSTSGGNVWISSTSTGLIFTDLTEAQNGYFYNYASKTPIQTCASKAFGICEDSSKSCVFDFDPDLKSKLEFPYSCNPKDAKPPGFIETYRKWIIIAVIVAVVILVIFILLFVFIAMSKKSKTT